MMSKNPGNEIRDALQAVHDAAANYYRVHNSHCDDDSGMGDLDSAFDEYWQSFGRQGGREATLVSFVRNQLQGDVDGGRLLLDEVIAPLGEEAGLVCEAILVNEQEFTKTANCWGVRNNRKGTNTNRIVLLTRQ